MQTRELFHGTSGDKILEIIRYGEMKPAANGEIFFSERTRDSVLMHGADIKRKATFAIKIRATIPPTATTRQTATSGVADTLIVTTTTPLPVVVLELYVRAPHGTSVKTVQGALEIQKYLSATPFTI